jgi:membrane associated rhomboid family serine protease
MFGGFGPASIVIMVITIIVSLIGLKSPHVIEKTVLRPYWVTRRGEWERLITSGFVHGSGGHLFFNMLSFFFFAFPLERRIGSARFIILYFAGLVLSDLGTWYKHRNNPDYASLGASGAVLAVMFAYIVYFPSAMLLVLVAVAPERGPHQSPRAHRRRHHGPAVRGGIRRGRVPGVIRRDQSAADIGWGAATAHQRSQQKPRLLLAATV